MKRIICSVTINTFPGTRTATTEVIVGESTWAKMTEDQKANFVLDHFVSSVTFREDK